MSDKRPSIAEERAAHQAEVARRRSARAAELADRFGDAPPAFVVLQAALVASVLILALGVGALWLPDSLGPAYGIVSLAAFALGVMMSAVGLLIAAARSRDDYVEIGNVIVGTDIAPRRVRQLLWANTILDLVGGIAIAIAAANGAGRVSTESVESGLYFFFGSMLLMFGVGFQLWWFARHGDFEPRELPGSDAEPTE